MTEISRRTFVTGATALGITAIGGLGTLTPRQARAQSLPFAALEQTQARMAEGLGEAMVPGAKVAGIAHYLDWQLSHPESSLLMAKYLGVNPESQLEFYTAGLDAASATLNSVADMTLEQLVDAMATDSVGPHWQGPPAGFFFFLLRADALDVVYGDVSGYESLGLPYAAHLDVPSRWRS